LYWDLSGIPPLLIYTGSDEFLGDDSRCLAAKAEAAGVDITSRIGKGLFNCCPACSPIVHKSKQAMDEIFGFIKTQIGKRCWTL